jgi:hypothetical protein
MGSLSRKLSRKIRRRFMKVLRLDGELKEHKRFYPILFTSVRSEPCKGVESFRRIGRILDKLEAIGDKETLPSRTEDPEDERYTWKLKGGDSELWFSDEEYSEIKRRFLDVSWHADASRDVVKFYEWLEAATTEEPAKANDKQVQED